MRTRPFATFLCVLICFGLLVACDRPSQVSSDIVTEELVFPTNVVEDTTNDTPLDVPATLYLPPAVHYPVSAVVIVPSSGGVEDEREVWYAKSLAAQGIAALVVDSFAARGVADSVFDQSALESWDEENDAIAALITLAGDGRIKRDRIAILGVSKGGTVARDTALEIRRKWTGIGELAFAAHVAISPDCSWTNRSSTTTGAPIFFALAELDDQTPPWPCMEQAVRILVEGNTKVETKLYRGAHHAWEELGEPEFVSKAENYSRCKVWIEDDGSMDSDDNGEPVPEKNWHEWAKSKCMTYGATCCGGTPELREAALQDIVGFLRKNGF